MTSWCEELRVRAMSDRGTLRLRTVCEQKMGNMMMMLVDVGMLVWHVVRAEGGVKRRRTRK